MSVFQIYLITVIFCIPLTLLLALIHDKALTLKNTTQTVLFGLVPVVNIVLLMLVINIVAEKYDRKIVG